MPDWKLEIREHLKQLNLDPARHQAIIEELSQHLDDHYADHIAKGDSHLLASHSTRTELAGSEFLARELRRMERKTTSNRVVIGAPGKSNVVADFFQDIRYVLRILSRQRGFALILVATLGLGIAINTAVYSVVDAVLFRPLPFAEPDRLVEVWHQDPVGKRIRFTKDGKWKTVVGVVGDVNIGRPGEGFSTMAIYYPWSQETNRAYQRTLIVRTKSNPSELIPAVRSAIWSADKDQPIYRIDTVSNRLSDALAEPRFYLFLFACFAGLTLLLVVMGIYGVMSNSVSERTREIGIRLALGADHADLVRLVMKRGLALTLTGVAIGIVTSLALSRLTAAILFGAPATDATTLATVGAALTIISLAACWIPAKRATRVDPLVALRCE